MKKLYLKLLIGFLFVFGAGITNAQVTVTNPGNTTPGLAATYADLAAAVTALNVQTAISGPVIITLDPANPQTSPAGGYSITAILAGASATNTVTIDGSNNTITASATHTVGALNDAIFQIIGGDFFTLQNFTMQENAANTTTAAATNNMTEWGVALLYATTTNGAQNNTIQNNTISLNRTYQNTFGIYSNTRHSAIAVTTTADITNATGSNSFNKIYGNRISNVNYGTVFIGSGALTAVAAQDNGTDIGGSSALTGNTYTNWGGIGVAISGYIGVTGSNYCIFVNNTYNDNISFNSITSFAASSGITMGGILKNYSTGTTAQPTGTIITSINSNTVTINNNPSLSTTGGIIGINNQGLSPYLSTATVNINNNTVQNCVLGGSISTTNGVTGITNLSLPGTVNMNGNSIINNAITATTATTGILNGMSNSGACGTLNMNTNIVRGHASTATSGQLQGITNSGVVITAINMNNNQLGNSSGGFFSTSTVTSGALFGIVSSGGGSTCTTTIQNNDIRGINYTLTASAAQNYIQSTAAVLTSLINNNTFTNLNINTTGTTTFISQTYTASATGTKTVSNNSIVTAFNRGGGSGNTLLVTDNGSSVTGSVSNCTNNNFSNITIAGTSTITGLNFTDGGTSPTKTITGNTFNNWTAITGAVIAMNITYWNGVSILSNNTITNITGQGAITGITMGSTANNATSVTISSNTINNLVSTGTGGTVTGIVCSNTSPGIIFSGNNINTLSSTGASSVNGINISGANTLGTNVFKNNIYNLSNTNATPTVNGILISGGTLVNVYNNFVSDLRAPNANAAVPIYGINNSGGTNVNLYYNTIALGKTATLTSTGAQFGVTGIGYSSSSNATLRNNIIWIDATPAGTGTISAVRRSAAGVFNTAPSATNFNSNNNIYHVVLAPGTAPVAANINKYLYLEGTVSTTATNGYGIDIGQADVPAQNLKSDINFNTACGLYKTFMATRDAGTFNEDNLTASGGPGFTFVPAGSSYASNSGQVISTPAITDDYNGALRSVTVPDMGALEFAGISIDATPPAISFTALPNTVCTSAPVLSATITDASGVNVSAGLAPRLYYRKGGATPEADVFLNYPAENTSAFNGWKYVEATGTAPNFSFAINYSLLTSAMATGDSLTYFVVAQDLAALPNVGKNSVTFPASYCPSSVVIPATGAVPTSSSRGYKLITAGTNQPSVATTTAGASNVQIIRIDFPAASCGDVTELIFNTNGTTNAADLSRARVYYTTSTTFATTTQFGAEITNPSGAMTFNGIVTPSTTLSNYFWLVYDINCAAPSVAGNVADAEFTSALIGGVTLTGLPVNPAGTRVINSLATSLTTNQPSTASVQSGSVNQQVLRLDILPSTCGNITQIDFSNLSTNVADISKARVFYTTSTTFATTTQFGSDVIAPAATFSVTGTLTPSSTLTNYFWLVYDIDCAAPGVAGNIADASVNSITIGGTAFAPTTINPTGTRSIVAALAGDDILNALTANMGTNAISITSSFTTQTGEVFPMSNVQGGARTLSSNYNWSSNAGVVSNSQWFKFTVPTVGAGSSGNLFISNSAGDAQIAVWSLPNMPTGCGNVANFTGAKMWQANEDGLDANGTLAKLRAKLTPGQTYYIQVDPYSSGTAISGNLVIEDMAAAPHSAPNNGMGTYFNPAGADMQFAAYEVNSTDGWTYYYNNNGTAANFGDDKILMAVNWSSNSNYIYGGTYLPGTEMVNHLGRSASSITAPPVDGTFGTGTDSLIVWVGRNNAAAASGDIALTDGGYVITPTWWMMNKFWNLIPKTQPSSSVGVRTYYSDADFTALQATVVGAGGTLAAHSDLKFIKATKAGGLHFSNAEVDPALGHPALTSGSVSNLVWVNTDAVEAGADPINQAEFNVTTFSGGGCGSAGNNLTPVPVKIEYFKGSKQNNGHLLDWKVTCYNSPSVTMILERSADGRKFTSINNQTETSLRCLQPFSFTDAAPLAGINYYRLKSVDIDGKESFSKIVALLNKDKGFEIVSLVPNPVRDEAVLSVSSATKSIIEIVVSDLSGKQLNKQRVSMIAGNNLLPINVRNLPAGTYQVTGITADGMTRTLRFVKQ